MGGGILYQVYIVDDDRLILTEIVETVPWADNGFHVCGFSWSPEKAIEEIMSCHPDVVFSDLKMPAYDGISMITILKEKGIRCEFVMLSAYGTFEDSRSFFLLNGFDYILKPLEQNDIQLVLERLYKKLLIKQGTKKTNEPVDANPAFLNLIAYVKEHYNEKLTLEKLAFHFNLNGNYICNLFSKHYKSTLTRFITELRMQEALKRLKESKKALKEIAFDIGYTDYYYFCKVFCEYYGEPPSELRNKLMDN